MLGPMVSTFDRGYMVGSQNKEPQYRPNNTKILIMETPKRVPLILRNLHIGFGIVHQLWTLLLGKGKMEIVIQGLGDPKP